jgi:hypothetical protein
MNTHALTLKGNQPAMLVGFLSMWLHFSSEKTLYSAINTAKETILLWEYGYIEHAANLQALSSTVRSGYV